MRPKLDCETNFLCDKNNNFFLNSILANLKNRLGTPIRRP